MKGARVMEKTETLSKIQDPNEHYLVFTGNDMQNLSNSEFIAEFAQAQAAQDYIKMMFQNRKFMGSLIFIAKKSRMNPVLMKEDLDGIIASSGEVFMDNGEMYDY